MSEVLERSLEPSICKSTGVQGLCEMFCWRTIGQPMQSLIGMIASKNNRFAAVLSVDKGSFENVGGNESFSVRRGACNKQSTNLAEDTPEEWKSSRLLPLKKETQPNGRSRRSAFPKSSASRRSSRA
jgi:hypothetical protein